MPGYSCRVTRPALRLPLLALALVVALVAAGCGGGEDEREEFAEQVRTSRDSADEALAQISNAQDFNDLLQRLRVASTGVEGAAEQLDGAEPPDGLADQAEELTDAYRALAEELDATVAALDEQFTEDSGTLQALEFENWERVQRALRGMRDEGIEVAPLDRHAPGQN
jgi:outer membrane PBP1 activator LpoA protein